MDPPNTDEVEVKPKSLEEVLGGDPVYHCELCDTEVVHKIAQELLPGLASACVDNTTGGIFKSPGSIAVDIRREMIDYLTERSENFVSEFILSENPPVEEVSEHPFDIISDLIDDFARTKRNMFSRVSEWILSDRREERIDDFVQEMEKNGFWLLGRRESVATTLLKNVDYKNSFHCNIICSSSEDLTEHINKCSFRTVDCDNEGCNARFCVGQMEHHDSICPFKILPCEQKCSDSLMRRDMDRHCITVCPMKLVNCSFYPVGCQSTIPRCSVEQHNLENLDSHLVYILQTIHKEASDEDLKHRVEALVKLTSPGKLARARDARSLTYLIKDPEVKLGPLAHVQKVSEIKTQVEESMESPRSSKGGSPAEKESPKTATFKDCFESPAKSEESPTKMESPKTATFKDCSESPVKSEEPPTKKEVYPESESPIEREECANSPVERQVHLESAITKEGSTDSPLKTEEWKDSLSGDREGMESPSKEDEHIRSLTKEWKESPSGEREGVESPSKDDEDIGSPTKEWKESPSGEREKEGVESPSKENEYIGSPTKTEVSITSPVKREDSTELPANEEEDTIQ